MRSANVATERSGRRPLVASIGSLGVLGLAVAAGLHSSPTGGSAVVFVDRLSSAITNALSGIGGRLLFAYAFFLGAATAFNPCGFGLLPAYLGLYLGDVGRSSLDRVTKLRRSVRVSVAVAVSFTGLFGVTGAIFSFAAASLVRWLPWLGLAVGAALVAVGGRTLAGRPLMLAASERAADRLGRHAAGSGTVAYTAFGIGFALASLGCSFPLFFALVGTAMAAGSVAAALGAFVLFGLGMATALGVVMILPAMMSIDAVRKGRRLTRVMTDVGGILVLFSGAYVVYYWLSAGRVLLA